MIKFGFEQIFCNILEALKKARGPKKINMVDRQDRKR
jgi:hypothetical protein